MSSDSKSKGRPLWLMIMFALLAGVLAIWFVRGRQAT